MLTDRCSHGKTWSGACPGCELVSALELVKRWKPVVEEAERQIKELTADESRKD